MNSVKGNIIPTVLICLVATSGLLVAFQGWNTRMFDFDLIPYLYDVRALLDFGAIPKKGTLTSFGSYTPPGITWLMWPGGLLFTDPRLYELPGCAILYTGTLVGIFLLARNHFGAGCAYLAVALWGLSELGLLFAQSSWARSHPFFYVWMVYWADKWVERNRTGYLAAAILVWAVGMYVFLEMAPALFILPVIWLIHRPSVRVLPLCISAALALIIWYPYVEFERTRNFVDLKSQVLRQRIRFSNFQEFWCNPALVPANWYTTSADGPSVSAQSDSQGLWRTFLSWVSPIWGRTSLILHRLLIANFDHAAQVPGIAMALMLVMLAGLGVLVIESIPTFKFDPTRPVAISVIRLFGAGAVLSGILLNEFLVARFLSTDGILQPSTRIAIRTLQMLMIIAGVLGVVFTHATISVLLRMVAAFQQGLAQDSSRRGIFLIALLLPWLIMLSVTELERLERFWWLWPLQIVAVAASVTYLPLQFGLSRTWTLILSGLVLVSVVGNPLLIARLGAWITDSWSGKPGEKLQVVDYLARQIKSSGNGNSAIGYQLYIYRFMANYHGMDARYKVGADFDLLLKSRHGIQNTNQCAEGVSAKDEYRVVQTTSDARDEAARQRIEIPGNDYFRLAGNFGYYQVLQHR